MCPALPILRPILAAGIYLAPSALAAQSPALDACSVLTREPRGLALKQLRDRGVNARTIDGLGDDAVFLPAEGERPLGTLFVRVGHWRITISRKPEPKGTPESTLPMLTTLAKAAVPKLRKAG